MNAKRPRIPCPVCGKEPRAFGSKYCSPSHAAQHIQELRYQEWENNGMVE